MFCVTVSSSVAVLVATVFLACAVEMVEALTIVLAVGHTRGWRSAFEGVAAAITALAAIVAVFGPLLVSVPLSALRLILGSVSLIFGLQWLRKAILRASGHKAKHDEDLIYEQTVAELRALGVEPGRDKVAFVMSFKGVFIEGLEVVVTVLTMGTSAHRLGLAATSATAALVIVAGVGTVVARQLSKVPENAMKMSVGVMLVSYGTFWVGEGLRVRWPGADAFLLVCVALYALATAAVVEVARRVTPVVVR